MDNRAYIEGLKAELAGYRARGMTAEAEGVLAELERVGVKRDVAVKQTAIKPTPEKRG